MDSMHSTSDKSSYNMSNGVQPDGRVVFTMNRKSTSRRFGSLLVGYATLKSPNNGVTGLVLHYCSCVTT